MLKGGDVAVAAGSRFGLAHEGSVMICRIYVWCTRDVGEPACSASGFWQARQRAAFHRACHRFLSGLAGKAVL